MSIYFHSKVLFETATSPSGLGAAYTQFFLFINSKASWNTEKGIESIAGKYCKKNMGQGSDTLEAQPNSVPCLVE
jgi:hypothetical protein